MKSKYARLFNHDDSAAHYDFDVKNESHPIRTGYNDLLNWMAGLANQRSDSSILELGSGTGNLTARLVNYSKVVCVDISSNMIQIAKDKLSSKSSIEFRQSDILELFERASPPFDLIISSYTIHHLTDEEKEELFEAIWKQLTPNGTAIFGDLMFENAVSKEIVLAEFKENGRPEMADEVAEEFFWDLDKSIATLERIGFTVTSKRFSALSFGIVAKKYE